MHIDVAIWTFLRNSIVVKVDKAYWTSNIFIYIFYFKVNVGSQSLFYLLFEIVHLHNLVVVVVKKLIINHCLKKIVYMFAGYSLTPASSSPIHTTTRGFTIFIDVDFKNFIFMFFLYDLELKGLGI